MVLQGYWQAEMSPEMKAAVLADWADELQDWTIEQIRWGLREWRKREPRRRPNPASISAILKEQRGRREMERAKARAAAQRPALKPRPAAKPDPERVARIMADLGFPREDRAREAR